MRRYGTPHCAGCPLKRRCTTSDIGRKIERPLHQAYTDRNDQRVARYKEFYRTRQEIIEQNTFHAVLEATKSLARKIRDKSGLDGDGAPLVDAAFGMAQQRLPVLAFNSLQKAELL